MNTMKTLGCFDYVKVAINNINLWDLASRLGDARSYKRMTVEFLSTLQTDDDIIKYRLYNHQYDITMEQLCAALSIPPIGENDIGTRVKRMKFWETIAMDERKIYGKDSCLITSIEFRYIHIILSNSIFLTCEETTEVNEKDIYIMRCIWSHKYQMHLDYHIVNNLKAVADDEKNNNVVMVGGFVTLLTYYHQMGLGEENHAYFIMK